MRSLLHWCLESFDGDIPQQFFEFWNDIFNVSLCRGCNGYPHQLSSVHQAATRYRQESIQGHQHP